MRHFGTALAVALVTFTAGTASAHDPRAGAPVPAVADTVTEPILLSAEQVKNYLAAAHALDQYWNADAAHKALYDQASRAMRCWKFYRENINIDGSGCGKGMTGVNEIDYATVAKRDPAAAAIFTANHITSKQWVDTRIAIYQAESWLDGLGSEPSLPAPASTSVLGKNMTVVQALRKDIAASNAYTM